MTEYTANNILTQEQQEAFDYDELWKDFIADFWREILEKFIPGLYIKADLNHEPEFLDKELHDIKNFANGEEQFDDITMIAFKYNGYSNK